MSVSKIVKIADFCSVGAGTTPARDQVERYYSGGTIPWVKSGELRERTIQDTEEHVTEAALRETSLKLVPAGALLLAMYGATVGRLGILGVPATTNQAVCHIVPNPQMADVRYLFHVLFSITSEIIGRSVGGAQPNINQGIVKDLPIPLPPLPEQNRIAAILDAADALRAKRRAALALLDTMAQEMFHQTFIEPGGFAFETIESACDLVTDGTHYTPTYADDGVVFLSARNVTSGYIDWDDIKYIPESLHQELSKRVTPKIDDILLAKNGTTGIAAIVDRDCIFDIYVSLALLRPSKKLLPQYLHQAVNSPYCSMQFKAALKGIGVPNLHLVDIRKSRIPVPPLPLQQKFAARIAALETLKSTHRKSLAELDVLFASLQHRAFRGEL